MDDFGSRPCQRIKVSCSIWDVCFGVCATVGTKTNIGVMKDEVLGTVLLLEPIVNHVATMMPQAY